MDAAQIAEAEKNLKEKEAEIERLKAEVAKAEGRVAGAEKKFSEWSNEVGEIRKEREALKATLADAEKTIAELKKAAGGQGSPGGSGGAPAGAGTVEKPEDIEGVLTEEQRKAAEAAFAALTNEEKIKYAGDSVFRLAFLKRVRDALPVVPQTPWSTKPDDKSPGDKGGVDAILDRVFSKKKKASFVPMGPSGGGASFSEDDKSEVPEDTRVH